MSKQAVFEIQINGVKESISAVDSLNKQLETLEQRIDALAKKNVNVSAKVSGSNTKELKQEEALLKKIDQLHQKVADTEKKEYQELLHAKEELKEYQTIAKAIAAEQNISSGVNNPNTMLGMKAQLHDIKAAMQIVDVDSDKFKQMQKQANDLNNKLKELESGYGQYGRNVGNYANGVAEGFEKIKVAVGGTTREYDNYRQAVKDLTQERFKLSQTLGRESEEYKKVDEALKQLKSDYDDLNTSSSFMDNMLDAMQSVTALASVGVGISNLFGIDDADFKDTMQKFASLSLIMQGIEKIQLQIQERQGIFGSFFAEIGDSAKKMLNTFTDSIDDASIKLEEFLLKRTKANKELEQNGFQLKGFNKKTGRFDWEGESDSDIFSEENSQYLNDLILKLGKVQDRLGLITKGVGFLTSGIKLLGKVASVAFSFIGGFLAMEALSAAMNFVTDIIKSLKTAENAAEQAAESLNAVNRQLDIQRDILSSNYLKGAINDEEFLNGVYKAQAEALKEQISLIQMRAQSLQKNASLWNMFDATQNTEFTGKRMNMPVTVGNGRLVSWASGGNDLQVTVDNVEELENAWNQCNEAISENKDYFDKWQGGLKGWWNSLWATVKDTEQVMRGMGNISLSDLVARFGEVNQKFEKGEISAEQFASELQKLKNEMNDNKILNSVIANLDKYIPDEEVRNAVQNIINEIYRLDDAFNMTSEGQIHYWNQVRIDAMKDGLNKELAQIQENERHEVVEYGKTQEQINLIHNKYARQRQNAQDKANKESANKAKDYAKKLKDAENELIAIRIENMKEGLEKELAQIENERRLALQKAQEYGKLSGQMQIEINRKYDRKILEEKRKWAFEVVKIYEDLEARIDQVNRTTFEKEVETAERNISRRESENIRGTGYQMITPSNYDNTKDLEAYYKKVYEIQKNALDLQAQVRQESLDKELEFNQKEEEIRHKRIVDENNGEFIQQLRNGLITQEQYDELIEKENAAHNARMNALNQEYNSQTKNITEENLKEVQELYASYFDKIVNGVAEDRAKIDEVVNQPLITDNDGWGIVDIGKNRQRFKQALSQYEELKKGIIEKQKELKKALDTSGITAEDFAIEQKALDEEMKAIDNAVTNIKQSSKSLLGDFFQSIQQYVQAVGQAATSIIQSIGEINDAAFENQMKALDRQTEYYEKQLEKQKEITQKYADDIDDIESELSDSRGDRRQFLIDQLNAQMEAQRQSLAQEKQIEKEQERIDRRKKDLEYQNEMRKWEQSKLTAAINAALAISNAAVNNWPIPAIPMMALATAVGAAQIAAVMAAKPKKYAKGGLLEGPSHNQGGIRAGNVELEGNEYVVNKQTAMQNLPLMNFINSRRKRIDLDDIVEFYSTGIKKNVSIVNKTKFADGGMLPTFRSDVDFEGNVLRAIEKYNERNVVVSVVDIINKSDNVKSVQALAGLS